MSYIATHVIDAEGRLLEQYKDKPNIKALIDSLVAPIQTLEDAFDDLNNKRGIAGAVGVQLDRLGDIVGVTRDGLSDEPYRTRIRIRVIQNLSQGEPDRLIQVYGSLLSASLVLYQENYPAGSNLMANADIPDSQATEIYKQIQEIAPVGSRVDYIGSFPAKAFAFAGGITQSAGFGSITDPSVGGGIGHLHIPVGIKFAFSGGNPDNLGFGALADPVMGGHFTEE
ncbi:MAG: hypothetical protein [Mu-like cryoconite phage AB09]|nr:MAG: hypothetical protein [Mu-like cryoconite phage AB09]